MLCLKALVYFNGMDNAKIFLLFVNRIHNCNIILALTIKKRGRGGTERRGRRRGRRERRKRRKGKKKKKRRKRQKKRKEEEEED